MADLLRIVSYGGTPINKLIPGNESAPYRAWINNAIANSGNFLATNPAQTVEVTRPGATPVYVRSQPLSRPLTFDIEVDTDQTAVEALQAIFDPSRGQQLLVVMDDSNNTRQALCQAEIEPWQSPFVWRATVRNSGAVWLDTSAATPDTQAVGGGGGEVLSWSITNAGNTETPVVVAITPSVAKDAADANNLRVRLSIANKSPRAFEDPIARGRALLLCDLSALPDPITPGNDVRVIQNGVEIPSWLSGNLLWTNLALPPMKSATLAANIDNAVTALLVDNVGGFGRDRWPDQFFCIIGSECIQVTSHGRYDATIVRGARKTTAAAHTAGDILYWVAQPFIDIIYGWSSPTPALRPNEEKPVIDLAASTNTSKKWTDTFLPVPGEHRSETWQPYFTDQGVGAQHIRQFGDGVSLVYENNQPAAGKPGLNDAVQDFPVPLASVTLDEDVGLSMLLRVYASDSEGYETKLVDQPYTPAPLTGQSFTPAANVSRLRGDGSIGIVVGSTGAPTGMDPINSAITPGSTGDPAPIFAEYQDAGISFTLDQQTKITGLGLRVAKSSVSAPSDSTLFAFIMPDAGNIQEVRSESIPVVGGGTPIPIVTPTVLVSGGFPVSSLPSWDETAPPSTVAPSVLSYGTGITLNAGRYWVSFVRNSNESGRLWFAKAPFSGRIGVRANNAPDPSATGWLAIFSDETPPQIDAPLDNGDEIQVANIIAALDATQAPLIVIGPQEDMYLLDAAYENTTRSETLGLFLPMATGATLTLTTGSDEHTAVDSETGLNLPWAVPEASSTARWLMLSGGANAFTWTEVGAKGLALVTAWTPRRL